MFNQNKIKLLSTSRFILSVILDVTTLVWWIFTDWLTKEIYSYSANQIIILLYVNFWLVYIYIYLIQLIHFKLTKE